MQTAIHCLYVRGGPHAGALIGAAARPRTARLVMRGMARVPAALRKGQHA